MDFLGFEKLLYHPQRLERLREGRKQFPLHLTLSLGNYCNHKCLWCTAYEYQQSKAKKIDKNLLLNFLEIAANRGTKAIGYVGNGEPTAFKDFGSLTREIAELGLQQGIFTNGYLIDRYKEQFLNFFTYIRISLDAGSAEMHSLMHDVPDQFDKIIDNIADLVKTKKSEFPTIGIQYATHHRNFIDLRKSAQLAKEIGADYFSIKPVFNRGSVGERIEKNELTIEGMSPLVSELQQELECASFKIFFRPHQIESEAANKNILNYDKCVAGTFNLNVYEDGSLVYCGPHRVSVGNIGDDFDLIERRIIEISEKLDLSTCPAGCRYHALNHLVDSVLKPEKAAAYHINFI